MKQQDPPVIPPERGERCPVEMLQNEREFAKLLDIFRRKAPRSVLEIGSMYGGTLWHWIMNSEPETKIVSVDLTVPPEDERYAAVVEAKKLWGGWAARSGVDLVAIEGSSQDPKVIEQVAAAAVTDGLFDFAFIDGNHEHVAVLQDYGLVSSLMNRGGIMAFHDTAELIRPAWHAIQLCHNPKRIYEFIARPGEWGIGVIQFP